MDLATLKYRLSVWLGRETARQLSRLHNGTDEERLDAARALRGLPLRGRAVARLIQALDDPNPFVRWEVAETLARVGGKAARAALVERAKQEEPAAGTAAALRALGLMRDPLFVDTIASQAEHQSAEVRVAVAEALAALTAEARAREVLLDLLADDDPVVRRAAAWAIRRADDPWAREVLAARAAQEPEPWLKVVLTRALEQATP